MSGLLVSLQGAVAQGVLWGIMVLGVYITFRLMDIADMTVDGSFALGACVCAVLVVNKGVNPVLALLVAVAAGVVAGAVTGILHTVFEIPAILAGILTQISLWSINLRIMGGKSIRIIVEVPKDLTAPQREALKNFKDTMGYSDVTPDEKRGFFGKKKK